MSYYDDQKAENTFRVSGGGYGGGHSGGGYGGHGGGGYGGSSSSVGLCELLAVAAGALVAAAAAAALFLAVTGGKRKRRSFSQIFEDFEKSDIFEGNS